MLVTFLIPIILNIWLTFCAEHNSSGERNSTVLEALFRQKYMSGAAYAEWKDLHEANTTTLSHVCLKYVFRISTAKEVLAEPEKKLRRRHKFMNHTGPLLELDVLKCEITMIGESKDVKGRQLFYLAEGDEPNSAFKFAIFDGLIFLTRKFTEIWA